MGKGDNLSVDVLIRENQEKIAELKQLVEDKTKNLDLGRLDPKPGEESLFCTKIDDIFYLRHVLSAKDKVSVEELAEDVVAGLEWRLENAERAEKGSHYLKEHLAYAYTGDLPNGTPVSVFSLAQSNLKELKELTKTSESDLEEFMKYEKEKIFQLCDNRTREKKKLVKSITVIDGKGISFQQFKTVHGVFKLLNKNRGFKPHPQLSQATVVVNIQAMAASLIRRLLKNVTAVSSSEFLRKFEAIQAVPSFLGGKANRNWDNRKLSAPQVFPPAKTNCVIGEGEDHWKLRDGNCYTWNYDISKENCVICFLCDTKTKKQVNVSACLKDPTSDKVKISFEPTVVDHKLIMYRFGSETGRFEFSIENPATKWGSRMRRKLKRRKSSFGSFVFRIELDENDEDEEDELFMHKKSNDSSRNSSIQDSSICDDEEDDFGFRKSEENEGEEEEEEQQETADSYLDFLLPYFPSVVGLISSK